MLYGSATRFDVTENLENFLVFWVALFSSQIFLVLGTVAFRFYSTNIVQSQSN